MMHISFFGLLVDAVDLLRLFHRAERSDGKHLRLSARKQAAAMRTADQADFGRKRPDLVQATAVHAFAVFQQPAADDLFRIL